MKESVIEAKEAKPLEVKELDLMPYFGSFDLSVKQSFYAFVNRK